MPKVTKDVEKDDKSKKKSTTSKKTTTKKKVISNTSKSATTKKKASTSKKVATKKKATSTVSKVAATNKKASTSKKTTTKKKATSTTSKSAATKKKASTSKKTSTRVKKLESNIIAEYYDLPYRYNETIVKILYQTPTVLFVYWDISDSDKDRFLKEYGENFFYNTKPILKVFNLTKNYSFEVEINDFANSWYIQVNDANCDYKVELARKTFAQEINHSNYIYVSSSNQINFPNDHILLEELPDVIYFKNVKTNERIAKDIRTLHLIGIHKIFNIYDFYKRFYKDEILEDINHKKLMNPSSSFSSWS